MTRTPSPFERDADGVIPIQSLFLVLCSHFSQGQLCERSK